jgi:uncharacterized protein YraI
MATLSKRPGRIVAVPAALLAALLLAGCGGLGGAEATPLPTRTPLPTFTATPEGGAPVESIPPSDAAAEATAPPADAAQPPADAAAPPAAVPVTDTQGTTDTDAVVINTPAPAQTPTPAAPPTAAAAQVTTNDIVNIRSGPGTAYGLVGSAQTGETFPVTGKNQAGDWWQINYNGQTGWIFGQLVSASGTEGVAVAQNIPAVPTAAPVPPTNTPAPQPTAPPAAAAPPPAEAPAQPTTAPVQASDNLPYALGGSVNCQPNPGITYFKGFTRDAANNLINGVCIHIAFYEPRTTKCSGCDGVGDGNWGFAPFGNNTAPRGTPIEIYVVECPPNLPLSGQSEGFTNLTPQSPKWTRVINDSEQCEGITFYKK